MSIKADGMDKEINFESKQGVLVQTANGDRR